MTEGPSERQIAESLCLIFSALEQLHDAGLRDGRASRVRREAVHFLWELREGTKLSEDRPHSVAAWACRMDGAKALLRYEHSVPVAVFMPVLRAAAGNPDAMLEALKRYVRPVIVTEDEAHRLAREGLNHSLPPGVEADDWAARYRTVGVRLRDEGSALGLA